MKIKKLNESLNEKLEWKDYKSLSNAESLYHLVAYGDKQISDELSEAIINANKAVENAYILYDDQILQPKRESEAKKEKERLDKSAIKMPLTQSQADLIDVVLGQMSDGYWENNKAYDVYWKNMYIDGTNLIVDIDRMRYNFPWQKQDELIALFKDPIEIKKWFARKAQIVQNADKRDNNVLGSDQAHYLDRGVNQTIDQIQDAINSLK